MADIVERLLSTHPARPELVVHEMDPAQAAPTELWPEEFALIERAIAKRQCEFAAGRILARRAMKTLGVSEKPILRGQDRAPIWPSGLTGSITHTRSHCAVVLARANGTVRAVGVDVEQSEPLKEHLLEAITTERERAWLGERHSPLLHAKALFSAKEAAYKAQYVMTNTYLGFGAMDVQLDLEAGTFEARMNQPVGEGAERFEIGHRFHGHVRIDGPLLATALVLPR